MFHSQQRIFIQCVKYQTSNGLNWHKVICISKYYCFLFIHFVQYWHLRPGSSVGIATELRAGRSGIESRWGRDFSPVQTGPRAHPSSCKMGTGSFPGVKCGRGVLLTTHLPSSAAVMEEYSYTSTRPLGHTGPVKGTLYLTFIDI